MFIEDVCTPWVDQGLSGLFLIALIRILTSDSALRSFEKGLITLV